MHFCGCISWTLTYGNIEMLNMLRATKFDSARDDVKAKEKLFSQFSAQRANILIKMLSGSKNLFGVSYTYTRGGLNLYASSPRRGCLRCNEERSSSMKLGLDGEKEKVGRRFTEPYWKGNFHNAIFRVDWRICRDDKKTRMLQTEQRHGMKLMALSRWM